MPYLLGADFAIQALKGRVEPRAVLDRLDPAEVTVSWVTLGEVYEGAFAFANHEAHLDRFRRFFDAFSIVDFDDEVMRRFGELRASLRRQGQRIPEIDLLVAAIALEYDLTILTYDRRHFGRIPDVRFFPIAPRDSAR